MANETTEVGWYRDAAGRQCWWTPNEPFTHGQPVGDIKPPDFHLVPRVRVSLPSWWQRIVVARVGGLYHLGKLWLCIHDHGASLAWVDDMVERWRIGR